MNLLAEQALSLQGGSFVFKPSPLRIKEMKSFPRVQLIQCLTIEITSLAPKAERPHKGANLLSQMAEAAGLAALAAVAATTIHNDLLF